MEKMKKNKINIIFVLWILILLVLNQILYILNADVIFFILCSIFGFLTIVGLWYTFWVKPQNEFEKVIPTLIEYAQGSLNAKTLPMNTRWSHLSSLYVAVYNSASEALRQRSKMESDNYKMAKLEGIVSTAQMVAHDLRQPLNLMRLLLSLPSENWKDRALQDELHSSLHIAECTLNDLLDFASPTESRVEPCDASTVCLNVINIFKVHEKYEHIRFSYKIHYKTLLDIKKFQRILQNLLSNALNYSDPKTEIVLNVFEEEHRTCFRLTNECCTLTPSIVSDFFNPMKSYQGGHGLGLAASLANAQAMGGSLEVEWTPPQVALVFKAPSSLIPLEKS